jgi:hypothetical protein
VRDCKGTGPIEMVGCTVQANEFAGAH